MAESRYYRVAEHIFSIEGAAQHMALLSNYAPFEIAADEALGQSTIFRLRIASEPIPSAMDMEHMFTDSSDEDMPRIEVYRTQELDGTQGWLLAESIWRNSEICCRIHCTSDFSRAVLYIATPDVRFAIDNAAMLLFAFATVPLDTLEMHASVIKREGVGYMFLGKSGTGKSTHSRQWMQAFDDAVLLNDDNPVVRVWREPQGVRVVVYGSPWSGKTPCYKNDSAPVQAIVKLSQAPVNEIRPLRLPEAYAYVLSSSSGLKILPEMMDALYNTIATLIQSVQVYGMDCLPNPDAALVCYDGTQGRK